MGSVASLTSAPATPIRWLAVTAVALTMLATTEAVEPYRLPSAKLEKARLDGEKSLKPEKLTPYRPTRVSAKRPGKNDFPARYTRKKEGSERVSR